MTVSRLSTIDIPRHLNSYPAHRLCLNPMVQCIETLRFSTPSDLNSPCSEQNSQRNDLRRFIDKLDLDALNQQFAQATPQEILAWCTQNISQGLVQTVSFSLLVVTHMFYKELKHPVPVIFLDTLHLFPETLETAEKAKAAYGLDLHTYRAVDADSREAFEQRYGARLWAEDVDRFYAVTKVEPLQRALDELEAVAWITGRRRDQSEVRQDLSIFERDQQGRLKVNPLANWTKEAVWSYIFEHDVPYNPLHDQGYTSIGDQPLTTPTAVNEDERAGRWRGTEKTECGIHW